MNKKTLRSWTRLIQVSWFLVCLVLVSRISNLLVWPAAPPWTIALMSAQRDGTISATRSTPDNWTPSTPWFSQKTRADWGDKTTVKTSQNHLTVKTWPTLKTRPCCWTAFIVQYGIFRDFKEEIVTLIGPWGFSWTKKPSWFYMWTVLMGREPNYIYKFSCSNFSVDFQLFKSDKQQLISLVMFLLRLTSPPLVSQLRWSHWR